MIDIPVYLLLAINVVSALVCCAVPLRRALHIYQLCSYQNLSYGFYLKEHRGETFSPRRILPLLFLFTGVVSGLWYVTIFAAVIFPLINQYPKAKKPLVYTARAKRLIFTATLIFALVMALDCWLMTSGLPLIARSLPDWMMMAAGFAIPLLPCLLAFTQPWLMMLYGTINSPIERAGANKYINQAKKILSGMPGLKIIGITGSYGKTSTKYFLEQLLSVKYNVYMTPGNFNTTLGVVRAIREGLRPTHEVFLCEMGARHRGDIKEICDLVHPCAGIITYIGQQHMETFGSQEAITKTKLELYDALRGRGPVYLNGDSPEIAALSLSGDVHFYGSGSGAEYRFSGLVIDSSGSRFTVTAPSGESQEFKTKLLGRANAENLCGAIAVCCGMGIPLSKLVPAVLSLQPVPHRLQLIPGGNMTIIDDAYNSNPKGAQVALETLSLCSGCKIVVTPGLVELGKGEAEQNRLVGRRAAAVCDYIVTVGGKRGRDIRIGAQEAGFPREKIHAAADLNAAMAYVRSLKEQDKMVLLLNDLTDNY